MLRMRRQEFDQSIERLTSWEGFVEALDRRRMVLTPWSASLPAAQLGVKAALELTPLAASAALSRRLGIAQQRMLHSSLAAFLQGRCC